MVVNPQQVKAWVTGPKGGKFYVTQAGKKIYGKEAERAARAELGPSKDPLARVAAAKANVVSPAKTPADAIRAMMKVTPADEKRADEAIKSIDNYSLPKEWRDKVTQEKAADGSIEFSVGAMNFSIETNSSPTEIFHLAQDLAERAARDASPEALAVSEHIYKIYRERELAHAEEIEPGYRPEYLPSPLRNFAVRQHFESVGMSNVHDAQSSGWVDSSSSADAMQLHGALESLGVSGSFKMDRDSNIGGSNTRLKEYVKEMYLLSQASLRAQGIDKITLYRGVAIDPVDADQAKIATRPASSWTPKESVARKFASGSVSEHTSSDAEAHVLRVEVPREQVYAHHGLFGNVSGENEYVLIGMNDETVNVDRLSSIEGQPASDEE